MSAWPEITPEQIVARLRMIVSEPESLCKTDLHYIEDAADEIERLRAELVRKADELEMVTAQRDHARRIVCRLTKKTYRTLKETAILRRWDCFKENKR